MAGVGTMGMIIESEPAANDGSTMIHESAVLMLLTRA